MGKKNASAYYPPTYMAYMCRVSIKYISHSHYQQLPPCLPPSLQRKRMQGQTPHLVSFCPLSSRPKHLHPSRSLVPFTITTPRRAESSLRQWSSHARPPHCCCALQVPGRHMDGRGNNRESRGDDNSSFEFCQIGRPGNTWLKKEGSTRTRVCFCFCFVYVRDL